MINLMYTLSSILFIGLIIGIISPTTVIRWGDVEQRTRKNVWKYYGISFVVLSCVIGAFTDSATEASSTNANTQTKENQEKAINIDEEMSKYIVGEYDYLNLYIKKYNIKLNEFDDKEKVGNKIQELNNKGTGNMMYLATDPHLFSDSNYKVTNNITKLIYSGETKDNKPDGVGVITETVSSTGGENINFVKYMGKFKDGLFEGYGMMFHVPSGEELFEANSLFDRDIGKAAKHTNPLVFEGNFKNGKPNGEGNYFIHPNARIEFENDKKLDFIEVYVGKFELDKEEDGVTGKGKEYSYGYLLYDGEFKNGEYNGNGTLYFKKSKQIQYKGELTQGQYNGKGTLYDESGKEVYSGEWSRGDYK